MKLEFNPDDPFPLIAEGEITYAEEQVHAEKVDAHLGLEIAKIEAALVPPIAGDHQLWMGLPPKRMLTPYLEIRRLLDFLKPSRDQAVIDLGAGYGRMGFVMGRHFPESYWLGYEYVGERVGEGERALMRMGYARSRLVQTDLSDYRFTPRFADFYFLYDYGTREAIEKTVQDLKTISKNRSITVIGRGRASRDAIERFHPWLSGVRAPEHFPHYSIYRS